MGSMNALLYLHLEAEVSALQDKAMQSHSLNWKLNDPQRDSALLATGQPHRDAPIVQV